jgi:hypothetical protein
MRAAAHKFACAAALSLMLLGPGSARADDQSELDKARLAFQARNVAEAERRLRTLCDGEPPSGEGRAKDPQLRSQARMYLGAILVLGARKDEAATQFERLLLDDPQFEPDPLSFPTEVLNSFIDVRATLRDRLQAAAQLAAKQAAEARAREEADRKREAQRVRMLEELAREEKITVRHSRLVASVPFGVGQFQNGQNALGWIFLGSEVALLTASVITLPIYATAVARQDEEAAAGDPERKADEYHRRAEAAQLANLGINAAFLLTAGVGVLQAHLSYVDAKVERRLRPLDLKVQPTASLLPGGGMAGLGGRF